MNGIGDLGGLFQNIMNDPQMLSKALSMASALKESGIMDMIQNSSGGENTAKKSSETEAETATEAGDGNVGKSNNNAETDMKNGLAGLLGALGNFSGKESEDASGNKSSGTEPPGKSERRELIRAIKPYLSPRRRENADVLINILSLLDMPGLNQAQKSKDEVI